MNDNLKNQRGPADYTAIKTPKEHPRTWQLLGMASVGFFAFWSVRTLIFISADESARPLPDNVSLWWLLIAIIFGVTSVVMPRRERRQMMEHLRRLNRGEMDQPGWTKKPWQHDIGEKK